MNTIFYYEGGSQVHKFMNTTTLPVYVEVIEFKPRAPIAYSQRRGDFGTGTNVTALAFPGMFETISQDLSRLRDFDLSDVITGANRDNLGPDNLWNELDDKGFHYTKFCKETNMRWVVSEKTVHRVDPGQTFTYTMVLPPFTLKLKDLYDYINFNYNHVVGSSGVLAYGPTSANDRNAFFPKFSKFASVRMWGSTSYLANAAGTDPGENNTDTYANTFLFPGTASDVKTMNTGQTRAVATHSVRMTHTMSETHKCRTLGTYDKFSQDTYNWLPNAADKSNITLTDRMLYVDPLENHIEHVGGDL